MNLKLTKLQEHLRGYFYDVRIKDMGDDIKFIVDEQEVVMSKLFVQNCDIFTIVSNVVESAKNA